MQSEDIMDISKPEQRVLHLLAQGGRIDFEKDERGRIVGNNFLLVTCVLWEDCQNGPQ